MIKNIPASPDLAMAPLILLFSDSDAYRPEFGGTVLLLVPLSPCPTLLHFCPAFGSTELHPYIRVCCNRNAYSKVLMIAVIVEF